MIISKTPFRISFAGGGSDFENFYKKYKGAVVSTSINKYMYISVNKRFSGDIRINYSKTEHAKNFKLIKHPLVKNCLSLYKIKSGIEISSLADIPAGTGLSSSSAYTSGLINALSAYKNHKITKKILADQTCFIEIDKCKEPIGKQDQYAVTYGGLNFITFDKNRINVKKIKTSNHTLAKLEKSLVMIYTGSNRKSSSVLSETKKSINNNKSISYLREMVKLSYEMKKMLEKNTLDNFGELLNENWKLKKMLSASTSNKKIDYMYDKGMKNGATGGKLLGAGNGGFLLFFVKKDIQEDFKKKFSQNKILNFKFENKGSQIILNNNNLD